MLRNVPKCRRNGWARHFADEQAGQHYSELYFLGEVPQEMTDFMVFYEARRERLQKKVGQIVNSV